VIGGGGSIGKAISVLRPFHAKVDLSANTVVNAKLLDIRHALVTRGLQLRAGRWLERLDIASHELERGSTRGGGRGRGCRVAAAAKQPARAGVADA
jgi:hypothetical protein